MDGERNRPSDHRRREVLRRPRPRSGHHGPHSRPDGRTIRPEFVIIDDPQTSESAGSMEQTRKRVRVLAGDILGLAGPGRKISGIMPCTVIRPGDMAEQILDKSRHPEWNGERCKMLYQMPSNDELWAKYADIRADELREHGTFAKATEFYRTHREEMDEGAVVSWSARYNYDEISAVQHAMNLKLQDEAAFWAEYQNEPLPEDLGSDEQLTVDGIVNRLNGGSRGTVPAWASHITMFIDVQKTLLFYVVCAWSDEFTGAVVDYGAWPDQRRRYFTLAEANPTLQSKHPRTGLEGCLYAGMKELTEKYLGKEYTRDDGAAMRIEKCLIDANWGQSTEVVYQFCRESSYANIIVPSLLVYWMKQTSLLASVTWAAVRFPFSSSFSSSITKPEPMDLPLAYVASTYTTLSTLFLYSSTGVRASPV